MFAFVKLNLLDKPAFELEYLDLIIWKQREREKKKQRQKRVKELVIFLKINFDNIIQLNYWNFSKIVLQFLKKIINQN